MICADISAVLIDSCGSDLSVVNAARVSFENESEWGVVDINGHVARVLTTKDSKLISYLAKHKHTSPFNHCFASFRVKAPIFVARQLVKHKFLPWNEVSRRYVDSEPEFFIPHGFRAAAENVKQGSSSDIVSVIGGKDGALLIRPKKACQDSTELALQTYKTMINGGVCAEQARMVLPQNTMTEWIWSGTLGAWADMCRLRLDPHSQLETRSVAELISSHMQELYPHSWKALINHEQT